MRDALAACSSISAVAKAISDVVGQDARVWETHLLPCLADGSAAEAKWCVSRVDVSWYFYHRSLTGPRDGAAMAYTGRRPRRHEIRDFLSVDLPARHLPPRAATSPAAHAVFDLLDTDRDGVVRRAEFFDAVGAVNQVVPPERRIDGDSVWGLLDCNGDGELERNELERGLRI